MKRVPGSIALCAMASMILAVGCAGVRVVRQHPAQERLERLLAAVLPGTAQPQTHYWVRVLQAKKDAPDLWILPDGHLYFSESLVSQADDKILTALLAHGVAHSELRHHAKRELVQGVVTVASAVGGIAVPGVQAVALVADPATERLMSAGQEFSADERAVTYLTSLGSSVEDYMQALQFMATHGCRERTGWAMTTQAGFSLRIAALKRRHVSQYEATLQAPQDR